jgi:hypothetical protein
MADYLDTDPIAAPLPKIKPIHLSREWNRLLTSGGRGAHWESAQPQDRPEYRRAGVKRLHAWHALGNRRSEPGAGFRAASGARRGELPGLQWPDLQANQLNIGHSLLQVGQQVFLKEPKNAPTSATAIRAISVSAIRTARR